MVASIRGVNMRSVTIGQAPAPAAYDLFTFSTSASYDYGLGSYTGGTFDATKLPSNGSLTNAGLTANLSTGTGAFMTTITTSGMSIAEFTVGSFSFNPLTQCLYMGFCDDINGFDPDVPFGGAQSLYWISQNGFNDGGAWRVVQGGSSSGVDEYVAGDKIAIKIGPDYDPDELYFYKNGNLTLQARSVPISPTGRFIVGFCDLSQVDPPPQ